MRLVCTWLGATASSLTFWLKLLCMGCSIYLVTLELTQFLVDKPTTSSNEEMVLGRDDLPEVTVCVKPPFNQTVASRHGYDVAYAYRGARGKGGKDRFVGWGDGLMEKFLTVSKDAEIVTAKHLLVNGNKMTAEIRMRSPIYPFGRCSEIVAPSEGTVSSVYIYPVGGHNLSVYFRDVTNTQDYFPIPMSMKGEVKIPFDRFYKYRTEISKSVVNEDLGCQVYTSENPYSSCVRKEVNKKMVGLLGCLPPLLTNGENEEICKGKVNTSIDKSAVIKTQFINIYSSDFQPQTCMKPCIQTNYDTKKIYSLPTDKPSIRIVFGKTIKVLHIGY